MNRLYGFRQELQSEILGNAQNHGLSEYASHPSERI